MQFFLLWRKDSIRAYIIPSFLTYDLLKNETNHQDFCKKTTKKC